MKILITGATGFIGGHLITRLIKDKHQVYALVQPGTQKNLANKKVTAYPYDGDIEKLISYLRKTKFDGVVHLASLFLAAHEPKDVSGLIESNLLFATSVLEAAVQSQVKWFINTGTFWQHYDNQDYSPVNLYAATKQAFEDIAQYYVETTPINFVTLKLSDTFGPNDIRPKIFNLWARIAKSQEVLDMSPGEQTIDISYVENVIDGFVRLIDLLQTDQAKKIRGKSFALKSNKRITLKKLARVFEEATQTKLNINWGKKSYRPREVMVPWEKGKTIPGFKPKISLKEGIQKTFNEK